MRKFDARMIKMIVWVTVAIIAVAVGYSLDGFSVDG
jgi:hypothetical protein